MRAHNATERAAYRAWTFLDRARRLGTTTPPLRTLLDEGIVTMGRFSYGEPIVHVWRRTDGSPVGGRVHVGAFVSIATEVHIFTGGNHRTDWVSTFPFHHRFSLPGRDHYGHPVSRGDVTVGSDVWLGHGACLLSGTKVGHGAVVGAGAVVSGDVRPYAIVAGNPAREIRRRFTDDQVQALLALQWWSWPTERILDSVHLLCSSDVQALLDLGSYGP